MFTQRFIEIAVVGLLPILPAKANCQTIQAISGPAQNVRAEQLQQEATLLHADPARASEAARLYKQSAHLRTAGDPAAVESLALAAHLFGYAGRSLAARQTMEEAAERALAMGNVLRAARAYVEAAFFADVQHDRSDTARLGRKALLLAGSSVLTADERASILNRIRTNPTLASIEP
jgi:hypothetical protein